ncbi:MAG: arsenate reductase (glutaredoxin) [Bacteroidetes bacterium]|nr:arsenate reductase (glutaredoxin) [Bacteroidota bacterium]
MKIYHNTRCTTSCKTLELLKSKGLNPEIIDYLKNPPTLDELKDLIKKLGIPPENLVRKKEKIFIENYSNNSFSDDEWLELLAQNPKLIQRPIVVNGNRAIIGRPPENVIKLL